MNGLFGSRKAQMDTISSLGQIAIAIVVAAIILGFGATILTKIGDTQTDSVAIQDNETLTWQGNNSNHSLNADSRLIQSSVKLYNNGTIVNKGTGTNANYSTTTNAILIINVSNVWNGTPENSNVPNQLVTTDLNVSYQYNIGSSGLNTTRFGKQGMTTMADFIPPIAIIAVAAIILGILFVFFGRRRVEV